MNLYKKHLKDKDMKKGKWKITKISDVEIMITDGVVCSYGYISKCKTKMYYDAIYFPLYIHKEALKFAAKNINSIYN